MNQATGKAAGIFPLFVARVLHEVLRHGVPNVAWILQPGEDEFRRGIESLISQVMNGASLWRCGSCRGSSLYRGHP